MWCRLRRWLQLNWRRFVSEGVYPKISVRNSNVKIRNSIEISSTSLQRYVQVPGISLRWRIQLEVLGFIPWNWTVFPQFLTIIFSFHIVQPRKSTLVGPALAYHTWSKCTIRIKLESRRLSLAHCSDLLIAVVPFQWIHKYRADQRNWLPNRWGLKTSFTWTMKCLRFSHYYINRWGSLILRLIRISNGFSSSSPSLPFFLSSLLSEQIDGGSNSPGFVLLFVVNHPLDCNPQNKVKKMR